MKGKEIKKEKKKEKNGNDKLKSMSNYQKEKTGKQEFSINPIPKKQ